MSQSVLLTIAFQHFGEPTEQERQAFTLVLKGHIAMDTLVYPNGTTGVLRCRFRILSISLSVDYRNAYVCFPYHAGPAANSPDMTLQRLFRTSASVETRSRYVEYGTTWPLTLVHVL